MDSLNKSGDKNYNLSSSKQDWKKCISPVKSSPPELVHYLKDQLSPKPNNGNSPPQLLPEVIVTRNKITKIATTSMTDDSKSTQLKTSRSCVKAVHKGKQKCARNILSNNKHSMSSVPSKPVESFNTTVEITCSASKDLSEVNKGCAFKDNSCHTPTLVGGFRTVGKLHANYAINDARNSENLNSVSECADKSVNTDIVCGPNFSKSHLLKGKESSVNPSIANYSETSSDVPEYEPLDLEASWSEDDMFEGYFKIANCVSTGKEERDTIDGYEFLSFETEHDMVEFTKIELDFKGVSLLDDNLAQSDDGLDMMYEAYGDSESQSVSQAIVPTKTKDITKIKGWRTKQFLVNYNPSHTSSTSIVCDEEDDGFVSCDIKIEEESNLEQNDREFVKEEQAQIEHMGVIREIEKFEDIFNQPGSSTGVKENSTGTVSPILDCNVDTVTEPLTKNLEVTFDQKFEETVAKPIFLSDALNNFLATNSDKISLVSETHIQKGIACKPDEIRNPSPVDKAENIKSSQSNFGPKPKTLAEKRKLLESGGNHEIKKKKLDETCNLRGKAVILQTYENKQKQNLQSADCLETRKKAGDPEQLAAKHAFRTSSRSGEHLKIHTDNNLKIVSTPRKKGNIYISKDFTESVLCKTNTTSTICSVSKNTLYNQSCEKEDIKPENYPDPPKVPSQIIKDEENANYGISFYSGVGKPLARRIVAHLDRIRFNVYDIDKNWANFAASVILPKNWKPESLPKNHIILPVKQSNFCITGVAQEIQRSSLEEPILKTDNTTENLNSAMSKDSKIEIPIEIISTVQDIICYIELKEQGDFVSSDPDEPFNLKVNENDPSERYEEQNDNAYNVTKTKSFKRRKTVMFRELRRLDVNYIEMNSDNSKIDSIDNINVNCSEVYCKLGCVCKSLLFCKPLLEHCGLAGCMFQCTCTTPFCPKDENSRPSLLFPRTVLRLQTETGRNLAKEEREFQHTVIRGKEGVIVVGGDGNVRKKREIKLPGRLRDSIFCSEFSIQDFKLNLSEEERFIAKKSLNSKLSLQANDKKRMSNKITKSEILSIENQSSKGLDPARRQNSLLPKRKLEEDNYFVPKRLCLLPTSTVMENKKISPLKSVDFRKSSMENLNNVDKIDSAASIDCLQQQAHFQKFTDDNTSQDITTNEYSDLHQLFGIEQCYVSLKKLKGRPHKPPFCMNHLKYSCYCIQRSKSSSPTALCKLIEINTVIKKMSEPTGSYNPAIIMNRGLLTRRRNRNVARKSTTTVNKWGNSKFNVKRISTEGLCQEITSEKSHLKTLLCNKNSDEMHQGIKIAGVTSLSLEEFSKQEKLEEISKTIVDETDKLTSFNSHNLSKHEEKSVIYEPKLLVSDMKGKKHESDHMSLVVNLLKTRETELKMLLAHSYNRPDLRQRHKNSVQVLNWSVLKDLFFKDIVFVWLKNLNGRGKVIITDSNVKPNPHFINIKNLLDHDQSKPVVVDLLMSPSGDREKSRFGILICDGTFWEIAGTLIRQDWAKDKSSLDSRNSDPLSQGGECTNKCSINDKKVNDLPHLKTPTSVSSTNMENIISELLDLREDLKLKLEIVNVFITDETDNVSNFHITDSSDLKWFGVPFGNKYYIIYIESRKCVIKYKEVANVLCRCIKNKTSYCIPLLSSDSLIDVRYMTAPLFGIYTHYKFPNKIIIGPFSPHENPGINVLRVSNVSVDPSTSSQSINENSSRSKSSDQVSVCACSPETEKIITRLLNLPLGSDLSLQEVVINVTDEKSNIDKFKIPVFENHQWFGVPFNKSYHLIYVESKKCIVRNRDISSIMYRSRRNKTSYCIPLLESNIPRDVSSLTYPIFGVYTNFNVPYKVIIGPFINIENHGICAFNITNKSINLENIFRTYKGTCFQKQFVLEDADQLDQNISDLCKTDSKSEDEEQLTPADSPKEKKKQGVRKVPSLWNILTKDFNLEPCVRKVNCWLVPTIQNIGYISATYSKDRRLKFKHPSNHLREILTFTTIAAADKWLNKYLQSRIRFVPKHLTIFWQVRPLNYDLEGLKPFDSKILKGNYGLTYCGPFDIRLVKVSKAKQFGLKADDVHRLQEKLRRRDILDGFKRLETILLADNSKQMSRIRILKASIVVINTLKRQGDKLMELSNRLKDEKQTLLQQLYKLMTNMKHEEVVQDVVSKLQKVWTAKDVPLVQIDDEEIDVDDEVSSHSSNSIYLSSIDNSESRKNLIDIVSSDSDLDDYLSDEEESVLLQSEAPSDVLSGFIDDSVEDSSKIDDSVSMSISVVQDSDSQGSLPNLESNDEIVIEKCTEKENVASDSKPKFILRDIEALKNKVVISNSFASVTRTENILPSITQKIKKSLHNSITTTLNNQLIISRSKLNDLEVDPLALSSSFEDVTEKSAASPFARCSKYSESSISNKAIECIEISDSDSDSGENKLDEKLSSSANNVSTKYLKLAHLTDVENSAFSVTKENFVEAKDPLEISKPCKVNESPPLQIKLNSANQSKLFVKLLPNSNIHSSVNLTKPEKTIAQFPKLKVTPTTVQNSGVQYVFKRGNKVYVKTESGKPIPVVMQPNTNKKSLLNPAFRSSQFDTIVSRDATNRSILISNNLMPNIVKSFTTIPVTQQLDGTLQAMKVHQSDLGHVSCDTGANSQSTSFSNEACISVTKVGSSKQSDSTTNDVLTPSLVLGDVKKLGQFKFA